MDQNLVKYIFLLLVGTSVLNFVFSVLARLNTKNKQFNTLVYYWPSVILTFFIAGALRHDPIEIGLAYFFQAVSSNLYVKMLRDSLGIKTNWRLHLPLQTLGMLISGMLLTKTDVGFTFSLLPLCLAFSLPFYRPIYFALIQHRDQSNWVEKTLAVFFISAVIHHFNFAFFRLEPNAESWGWAITIAHYQSMSVFLPLLINHRREEKERRNLQLALEKLSGTNSLNLQTEQLYQELESQINQKEHYYEQLQATNRNLEEEQEMNEILIRTISHDLANPLTVVAAYIDLLQQNKIRPEEEGKIWSRLKYNTQSSMDMISRIRNAILTRTQASLTTIQDVSIDHAIKRLMETFGPRLIEKKLKLVYHNEAPPGLLVLAEENALCEHVFANILSNAIKFSYEEAEIHLSVRNISEKVEVEFRDFGIGIQESRIKGRLMMSTQGTKGEKGTGFGLMVMGYFIRKFNASMEISSSTHEIHHGTKVIIKLCKSGVPLKSPEILPSRDANIYS